METQAQSDERREMADDYFLRRAVRDHRRAKAAAQGLFDARTASREVSQVMDTRAPQDAITISLPIFIDRVPIEKKKGTYNRASTIEWIQEKLKAAGWDPWRELGLHHRNPIGPLAVTICSAALPPPKGLSKRGQAALEVDETVWRTGSPQAGALGDIVIEAMGLQRTQIVRLIVEKVYGRAPITTIMIEPLKT